MDIFGSIPWIETDRLLIHRPSEEDACWVRAMAEDKKVYRYLPGFLVELKFQEKLGAIAYIESYRVEVLAAYRKSQPDELIGLIEIYDYDPEKQIASLGYRFRSEFWEKGYATESIRGVLSFLWKYVNTVTAHVMIENTPSSHVLQKNGFHLGKTHFEEDWDRGALVLVDEFICEKPLKKDGCCRADIP